MIRLLLVCSILLTAPPKLAQFTGTSSEPVTLCYSYAKGDVYQSQVVLKSSLNNSAITSIRKFTRSVDDVRQNGDVVLKVVDEGGTIAYAGIDRVIPGGGVVSETINKSGKLLSYKQQQEIPSLFSPQVQRLLVTLEHIVLPDAPVKADDTWATTIDNTTSPSMSVILRGTFQGFEDVNGQRFLKVKQTAEVPTPQGEKILYEITGWFDPAKCLLVMTKAEARNVPTKFGVISWSIDSFNAKASNQD